MAKINLSTKVKLDITDEGKVVKSFDITYREPSKKEQKKLGKDNQDILDMFKQSQKLDKRIEIAKSKQFALEQMKGKGKELLNNVNDLEKLYKEKDGIDDRFEALGGFEKLLEASKETFYASIGGKDFDALCSFIEENGDYSDYLEAIAEDAKAKKGN